MMLVQTGAKSCTGTKISLLHHPVHFGQKEPLRINI